MVEKTLENKVEDKLVGNLCKIGLSTYLTAGSCFIGYEVFKNTYENTNNALNALGNAAIAAGIFLGVSLIPSRHK